MRKKAEPENKSCLDFLDDYLAELSALGLSSKKIKEVINNKKLLTALIKTTVEIIFPCAVDQQLLRAFSNKNFFSREDWFASNVILDSDSSNSLPVGISSLLKLTNSLCPFTAGKKIKETHFLMCLPKSRHLNDSIINLSISTSSYFGLNKEINIEAITNEDILHERITTTQNHQWVLICKQPVLLTAVKNLKEYSIASTLDIFLMHQLYYTKNSVDLNQAYPGLSKDNVEVVFNKNKLIFKQTTKTLDYVFVCHSLNL